jgi:hypothetical protein
LHHVHAGYPARKQPPNLPAPGGAAAIGSINEKLTLGHHPADGGAAGGRPELEGEVTWTETTTLVYPLICLLCGVAAGLLGIGGGMVVGPLLLELKDGSGLGDYNEKLGRKEGLGLSPQSIAATSAYTVLITASSATVQARPPCPAKKIPPPPTQNSLHKKFALGLSYPDSQSWYV